MIVDLIVSDFLDANCYVVAPARGGQALVIDPGAGTAAEISRRLAAYDLSIGAVLLTHGHPDHVWDAAAVAGQAPVYVPEPDLYRLDDPASAANMGEVFAAALSQLPMPWRTPENLRAVPAQAASQPVELVDDLAVRMLPAPGHSEGSAVFFVAGPITEGSAVACGEDAALICFDGDVIFAGAIGRTDLPGGDSRQMMHSLRTLLNVVDPETVLLPGHGPATTMGREAQTNPYLNQARHVG
ncbi:MBL fold metallo-hydrolase [Nanchangia anserum]|uniref:MBL fold metallo-hydrolase n=1 Tax=Nanchangia anserum TaxID=2692125 RepID=A0A8I0KQT4_9ACTO|nr:MBL fold metallo-hydrolase [Nanchangia anserum]MBD3688762.1 MBL fold metallo-hydrolase [Nanchangia anserum]QOX82502.1 MBL fold metallo-hydrolase [Nanchangia anserum]